MLDLNLPVLSGLEVCRIIRARSDAKSLPIIMLTARTSENDRVSGLEQGADVHVGRLRAKLKEAGRQIETVVGLGYRFVD
jgi:DNA-binding response OmpR family regulator